jgi:hypothetical protein
MTTIDGNDGEEGGSIVRRALTTAHSDKRQERPSTYHLKRLLDEACPNHTHPIRHKLKDCGMMRSFMTSMKGQTGEIRHLFLRKTSS